MAYPAYVREKARKLRVEKRLSIDEIAERLALPKTTIYYWVRDLPLGRERRANPGHGKGNRSMQCEVPTSPRGGLCAWAARVRTPHCVIPRSATSSASISPRATSATETGSPSAIRTPRWLSYARAGSGGSRGTLSASASSTTRTRTWKNSKSSGDGRSALRLSRFAFSGSRTAVNSAAARGGPDMEYSPFTRVTLLCVHASKAWIDCLQELWVDSAASGRSSAW